jgi:hypothetical protein
MAGGARHSIFSCPFFSAVDAALQRYFASRIGCRKIRSLEVERIESALPVIRQRPLNSRHR